MILEICKYAILAAIFATLESDFDGRFKVKDIIAGVDMIKIILRPEAFYLQRRFPE